MKYTYRRPTLSLFLALLLVLAGCDQGQLSGSADTGDAPATSSSDATQGATATQGAAAKAKAGPSVTISSLAELNDRLPDLGTPLDGSGQRIWLQDGETRQAAFSRFSANGPQKGSPTSSETGPFVRTPMAYSLPKGVKIPEPDAQDASSSEGVPSPNRICIPGAPPINCDPAPGGGGDDGGDDGGGGGYNPPNLDGRVALYTDSYIEGNVDAEVESETSRYVESIAAYSTVTFDINDGEYQETSPRLGTIQTNYDYVRNLSVFDMIAGQVDWFNQGEHEFTDNNGEYHGTTGDTHATANTNVQVSSCAPIPKYWNDGATFQEGDTFSPKWQTICPQDKKYFKVVRLSGDAGPGSSSEIEARGDGYGLEAYGIFEGLVLSGGEYEWRIRAEGESSYRAGAFTIESNGTCQLSLESLQRTSSGLDVEFRDCVAPGIYFLRPIGTDPDGSDIYGPVSEVQLTDSGSSPVPFSIPLPHDFPQHGRLAGKPEGGNYRVLAYF